MAASQNREELDCCRHCLWVCWIRPSTIEVVAHVPHRFSSGAYVGLILAPIMHLGGTGDVGRRVGLTTTSLAFGALAGPPISGAINDATGSFRAVGIYAGAFTFSLCTSSFHDRELTFRLRRRHDDYDFSGAHVHHTTPRPQATLGTILMQRQVPLLWGMVAFSSHRTLG